jgi:two-component system nitrogen regulation response regulator NtrX
LEVGMAKIPRTLIVEDDEDWRQQVKEILQDEGYHVSLATTLEQARAIVDACSIDVAIVDINLTDVTANRDGIAFLRYVVDSGLPTKVILLSGTEQQQAEAGYTPFRAFHKRERKVLYKLLEAVEEAVREPR